ncbi:MAG: tetratricopeptide repeat protein [Brevinema sp.]
MTFDLDQVMKYLIQKRLIVLGVFGAIIVASLGMGFLYQRKIDKSEEALVIFDEAWQKIGFVASKIQQNPNNPFPVTDPQTAQAKLLYTEGLESLDILISDYSETVAAARAASVYLSIIDVSNLNALVDDQELLNRMKSSDYLDRIQKKHKQFWDVLVALGEGTRKEQQGLHEEAIIFFQDALKKDNEKYMTDYILIAIARNYEIRNNNAEAIAYYQKVLPFSDSVWNNFANAKIYLLSKTPQDTQ